MQHCNYRIKSLLLQRRGEPERPHAQGPRKAPQSKTHLKPCRVPGRAASGTSVTAPRPRRSFAVTALKPHPSSRLWAVRAGGVAWGTAARPSPLGGVCTSSRLKSAPSSRLQFLRGRGPLLLPTPGEGVKGTAASRGLFGSGEKKAICKAHPLLARYRTPHLGSSYPEAPCLTRHCQPRQG